MLVCLCIFTAVVEDDETVSWAIRACQRCLIYLGDIGKSANIWISSKISFMFKSKSKLIVHLPVTRIFWKKYIVVVCKILSCIHVFLLQLDINQILKGKMPLNWLKGFTVKLP